MHFKGKRYFQCIIYNRALLTMIERVVFSSYSFSFKIE